jgi:two-component system response regulator DesR
LRVIRLVLADDQALVRGALAALLDLESDLEVVGEVGRGDEVVDAAVRERADVVLMDVQMPGLDGIAATAALRRLAPRIAVVIHTLRDDAQTEARARAAGAVAFVAKRGAADALLPAIRQAAGSAAGCGPL